ncbi:MAG: vitamin K epoxide reductase family protein [bacterium]|nr:vitamin K epoxide reductase family protein [bacterium]
MSKISKGIVIAFLVLSLIGFLDAAFLTVEHYRGLPPPCSILQGCEVVTTSKYSVVAGVPIALPGALYYLAIFLMSFLYLDIKNPKLIFYASFLAMAGFAVTLGLVYLQLFVLDAICLYCMVSAGITTTLFILGVRVIKAGNTVPAN